MALAPPTAGEPAFTNRLLTVDQLSLAFYLQGGAFRTILEAVTFSVSAGEVVGLCGPSGCGKSQTALGLMGLWPPDARKGGCISWKGGPNLLEASAKIWRGLRGSEIALVSQDPLAVMNPLMTVGRFLEEVLRMDGAGRRERRERGLDLLEVVSLPDPSKFWSRYPHELSGGQRQRIVLAAALARSPALLIADEPTTALDVSVQAKILRLLLDLRESRRLAILLITHDRVLVDKMCDRVVEMERGIARGSIG